ncbi:MAG TPA: hypothetical protein VI318_07830 [Baekduia sp.]
MFTAEEVGQDVVEPHRESEDGRGQQEVYVVLRGRVRFRLDGDEVDAGAGTFVCVDPPVHRQAVALEARTAVAVFGGEPVFAPSGHEYLMRVRWAVAEGDVEAATAIAEEGLADVAPGSPGIMYALALAAAARQDDDAARAHLAEALAAEPALRGELDRDAQLARLSDD